MRMVLGEWLTIINVVVCWLVKQVTSVTIGREAETTRKEAEAEWTR